MKKKPRRDNYNARPYAVKIYRRIDEKLRNYGFAGALWLGFSADHTFRY